MIEPVPIALLLAAAMVWAWRASARRGFLIVALLWAVYALYESLMYARILCTGECNIRIDLLLFYPLLLGSTLWVAVAAALRALKRRRPSQGDA